MGNTSYFPASAYHIAISSMSLSRCWQARLWFSAGSLGDPVQLPTLASRPVSVSAVISAPNGLPASANDGPGHGHTARHPSWSMARCPNISKYWTRCRVGASASSKECAKLTPCSGDWVTPLIAAGGCRPSAFRTVGTRSTTCAYWVRTAPRALMPCGQWTRNGSVVPPRYVSRFHRRNGVLPAQVQPHG